MLLGFCLLVLVWTDLVAHTHRWLDEMPPVHYRGFEHHASHRRSASSQSVQSMVEETTEAICGKAQDACSFFGRRSMTAALERFPGNERGSRDGWQRLTGRRARRARQIS